MSEDSWGEDLDPVAISNIDFAIAFLRNERKPITELLASQRLSDKAYLANIERSIMLQQMIDKLNNERTKALKQ